MAFAAPQPVGDELRQAGLRQGAAGDIERYGTDIRMTLHVDDASTTQRSMSRILPVFSAIGIKLPA
jgi:hypothetical protein